MVTLVTSLGIVTAYVPGVVDENTVAGAADAWSAVRTVVDAINNVANPPISSGLARTARRLPPRGISIELHPSLLTRTRRNTKGLALLRCSCHRDWPGVVVRPPQNEA